MLNNKYTLLLLVVGLVSLCKANPDGSSLTAETIESAMKFKMDRIIARYQKEHKISSDVAPTHERELKRYLLLAAAFPDKHFGMYSKDIDELWHTFLLFSHDYHKFCFQTAGRYIHHEPNDNPEEETSDKKGRLHELTQKYKEVFGEEFPYHIWGVAKECPPACWDLCAPGCYRAPCNISCQSTCNSK